MDVFGSVKCPPVSALLHKRVLHLTVWVCNYFYYTITLIPTAEVDWVTKPVCRDVVVFHIKDYGLKFIYLQSSACSHTYAVLSYLPITLSSEERRFFLSEMVTSHPVPWRRHECVQTMQTHLWPIQQDLELHRHLRRSGTWGSGRVEICSMCFHGFTLASSCSPKTCVLGSLVILHQEFKQK